MSQTGFVWVGICMADSNVENIPVFISIFIYSTKKVQLKKKSWLLHILYQSESKSYVSCTDHSTSHRVLLTAAQMLSSDESEPKNREKVPLSRWLCSSKFIQQP